MPAEQPELIAVLERLREELARTHAAGSVVQARLDGMAAPDGEQDGKQEREQEGEPEGEEPPAADSLAARLDLLFTDTYHALLADPPPAPERGAPLPLRPQLASQDDSIDNLFDAAFEDAFAEPPLEQAAAPQLSLVSPAAGDSGGAQPADAAAPAPLVRVRADILGHLVHQAREVAATQARLESEVGALRGTLDDFEGNLGTLRQQLREVEMQAEAQIASRLSIAGEREFDPQEFDRYTQLQDLARGMAASVDAAAATHARLLQAVASASDGLVRQSRNTGDLQRDLLRVQDEAGTQ
jgi:chemotaxis protein histidine kinase CheA